MVMSLKEYMERKERGEEVFNFPSSGLSKDDAFYDGLGEMIEETGYIGHIGCVGMRGHTGLDHELIS